MSDLTQGLKLAKECYELRQQIDASTDTVLAVCRKIDDLYNGVCSELPVGDPAVGRALHHDLWQNNFKDLRAAMNQITGLITYCRQSEGVVDKTKRILTAKTLTEELKNKTREVSNVFDTGIALQTGNAVLAILRGILTLLERSAPVASSTTVHSLDTIPVDLSRMVGRKEVRLHQYSRSSCKHSLMPSTKWRCYCFELVLADSRGASQAPIPGRYE